jgi:hypothetical protein
VTADDNSGKTVPGYTGAVQITSTDNSAMVNGGPVPAGYTFKVATDAGSHTFTVTLE